jgi:rhodanese-related sulfurtransferase
MNLRTPPARVRCLTALAICALCLAAAPAAVGIRKATLEEQGQRTPEISTDEMRLILREGSATVLDARPHAEYALSHIPGAKNVAAKPGVEKSMYVSDVAEVTRLVHEDKKAPIVLYCNGPFCGKSKRLADELQAAGYTNVRRYQLGIPVWRALGEVCAMDFEGFRSVIDKDRTAVLIDAREAKDFAAGSLPGSRNIPRSLVLDEKDTGEVKRAKDDGRLPMEDHNTRIFVLGEDGPGARYVAEALAREAFHNVAYYEGAFAQTGAAPER